MLRVQSHSPVTRRCLRFIRVSHYLKLGACLTATTLAVLARTVNTPIRLRVKC